MEINDQARKELLAQVEYLTDEVINRQPAEDRWSIKQILQHLYLMEGSVAKTIQIKLAAEDQNITIDKPIQLTVDRSNKIEAPDFVTPTLEYSTLHDLKSKLTATHSTLHDVAENATEDQY